MSKEVSFKNRDRHCFYRSFVFRIFEDTARENAVRGRKQKCLKI